MRAHAEVDHRMYTKYANAFEERLRCAAALACCGGGLARISPARPIRGMPGYADGGGRALRSCVALTPRLSSLRAPSLTPDVSLPAQDTWA